MKLLRALPWAAVVEPASIDEAYVLLSGGPGGAAVSPPAALSRAHEVKTAGEVLEGRARRVDSFRGTRMLPGPATLGA